MRRLTFCSILAVTAAGAAGAATQASGESATSAAATTLKLKAASSGALRFDKETLRAEPGKVTIRFRNPGSADAPHAVEVEGRGVEKESRTIQPGQRTKLSVRLERGRYEFYCPVGNHDSAGMEGTLIVR